MLGPASDCTLCSRLVEFRCENQRRFPDWHNAPVPPFGEDDTRTRLLIVGLAPGLRGANRTGRPFTGDHAGELLFSTLLELGLAEGRYGRAPDDGLRLRGCRITNAVRCVPPANRPLPMEMRTCSRFLKAEIAALTALRVIVALGTVAHAAVLTALDRPPGRFPFAHGARHRPGDGFVLLDSYHCSRQNTNTGRLTAAMFNSVFAAAKAAAG